MGEIVYNKLVRDGIPGIVEAEGKIAVTRVLTEAERATAVGKKVVEEATELLGAKTHEERIAERADLEEILAAYDAVYGITAEEVEDARHRKELARGAFGGLIFLEKVVDND